MADPSSPYPEVPDEVFERMRHRIEAAFMGALAAEPDAPARIDAVIIDTFRAGRAQAAADIREYVRQWDVTRHTGLYSKGLHDAARLAEGDPSKDLPAEPEEV